MISSGKNQLTKRTGLIMPMLIGHPQNGIPPFCSITLVSTLLCISHVPSHSFSPPCLSSLTSYNKKKKKKKKKKEKEKNNTCLVKDEHEEGDEPDVVRGRDQLSHRGIGPR